MVAEQGGQVEVVHHRHHLHGLALEALAHQLEDLQAVVDVEIGGGLVEQQHLGPLGQGPGHRHPLFFAAGQAGDRPVGQFLDAGGGERLVDQGQVGRGGRAEAVQVRVQSHLHHLAHGVTEADHEVLRHQGESPRQLLLRPAVQRSAAEGHPAGMRLEQAAEQVEQGGLAAAVGAEDAVAAARRQLQADVTEHHALAVAEVQTGERPQRQVGPVRSRWRHGAAVV